MPGSEEAWPASPTMSSFASGIARCSAQALAIGVTTSNRPWAIQVGSFTEKRAAQRLAETLAGGYAVEVLPAKRDGGRWRVRVQPIATEDRARATAERLKREEGLPTWVTPMGEGHGRAEGRSG